MEKITVRLRAVTLGTCDAYLITHEHPDLDAYLSLVAVRKYMPGAKNARIILRPARWNGNGMGPNDIAVDIEAGGRGLKGDIEVDGKRHSCFATIMLNHAPTEHQYWLRHLISYVDIGDSTGNVAKTLVPDAPQEAWDILSVGSVAAFVSALSIFHGGYASAAERVVERLEEYFEGMLIAGRKRAEAESKADDAEFFADGQVALVMNGGRSVTYELYSRGVRIVVFKNRYGIGVTREQTEKVRMDDPRFLAVIRAAGESVGAGSGEWFAHTEGFLLANGTPKSPAARVSKVDPRELAQVAVELLAESDAAKETAT